MSMTMTIAMALTMAETSVTRVAGEQIALLTIMTLIPIVVLTTKVILVATKVTSTVTIKRRQQQQYNDNNGDTHNNNVG